MDTLCSVALLFISFMALVVLSHSADETLMLRKAPRWVSSEGGICRQTASLGGKDIKSIFVYYDTLGGFIATESWTETSALPSLTSKNKGNKTNDIESNKKCKWNYFYCQFCCWNYMLMTLKECRILPLGPSQWSRLVSPLGRICRIFVGLCVAWASSRMNMVLQPFQTLF